ncbi:Protein of unknown function DUF58 [Methylomagnum ishizawai]|uniref:DUF58 domain-containing protein n=1 Tax=Methylomagnum ishizawai TaxID=1760988 RepID=A0A1Y6D2L4_9GAMM|nr:DUF58 domain-containing protein [Methylomagnum ishizawai]SMF96851.1 Protein of unknown function DUF58 [Methylomagnum ishizawai]
MIPEFHYAVGWRTAGLHPGGHVGARFGGGHEFAGHAPFLAHPDPRHLDFRASLRDPFGQLLTRTFRQRCSIPVYVLADLSASMGFRGSAAKLDLLARFAAACAYSAYRSGDGFGFIGCDEGIRWELCLPCRFHKGAGPELEARLKDFTPTGRSAGGLLEAAPHLGKRRALVFLVSDFHFPLAWAEGLLDALVRHDVVPVVVWDSAEYQRLPQFGLVAIEDPETGARRRLLMRPALRERFRAAFAARREALIRLCAYRGREPFFLADQFDADAMTRYFVSGVAPPS